MTSSAVFPASVMHNETSRQSAIASTLGPLTVKKILSATPVNSATIKILNGVNSGLSYLPEDKRLVTRLVKSENWFAHYVKKAKNDGSNKVVIYFHGGAFVSGGYGTHKRLIESIALNSSASVFAVSYRQFPQVTLFESVQDCIEAYNEVVSMGYDPENITLAGDSAGGALVVKVTAELIKQGMGASKIVTFSGWFDFSLTPLQYGELATREAYLPPSRISEVARIAVGRDLVDSDSPIFDVTKDFPDALLICGSDEALRLDTELMQERYTELGAKSDTHIFKGCVHAFPIGVGVFPEAKVAVSLLADFI